MSGHIEHKFEEWFDNTTGFTQEDKVLCFEAYKDAYDQGRRDLIEALEEGVTREAIKAAMRAETEGS